MHVKAQGYCGPVTNLSDEIFSVGFETDEMVIDRPLWTLAGSDYEDLFVAICLPMLSGVCVPGTGWDDS